MLCDRTLVMYAGRIVEEQPTGALFETPLHPYTARAGRRPAAARPPDDADPGDPGPAVSAFDAPAGCAFHPRCDYAAAACAEQVPPLERLSPTACSACLRVREIGAELQQEVAHA